VNRRDACELERAAAAAPENARLQCELSSAYLAEGKRREALEAARRALALDPELAFAHRTHARALARTRRPQRAIAAAREALRLEPSGPASLALLAELLAQSRRRRDRREGLELAEQLLRLAPAAAFAHSVHGRALLGRRRLAEAEAAYRRALELDPDDYAALNNLGIVLRRRALRSFRPSKAKLTREGLRQFAYAAETDPRQEVARANVFRASGGWALLRWTWLLPYFVLRTLGGPHESGAARWAATATLVCALAIGVLVAALEAVQRERTRHLTEAARRWVADETRRQRWRLWITAGVLALYVLCRWAWAWGAHPTDAPQGFAWLLLAALAGTLAAAAWNVAAAVRRGAWRI
jgi:tetratricopeptide (TPR) repeat protein